MILNLLCSVHLSLPICCCIDFTFVSIFEFLDHFLFLFKYFLLLFLFLILQFLFSPVDFFFDSMFFPNWFIIHFLYYSLASFINFRLDIVLKWVFLKMFFNSLFMSQIVLFLFIIKPFNNFIKVFLSHSAFMTAIRFN